MKYETIELGRYYWYNKDPYKVISITDGGARIVPYNKVMNLDLEYIAGLQISCKSELVAVSAEELSKFNMNVEGVKRRGRPKGSKKKDITLAEVVALVKTTKKRGRPKGSKNKTKVVK